MKFLGPSLSTQRIGRKLVAEPLGLSISTDASNIGQQLSFVILHDIDFSVGRPSIANAQGPPSRPHPFVNIDFTPHFEPTELPAIFSPGCQTGGSIIDGWTTLPPICTTAFIHRIRLGLSFGFYDKYAILAIGILGLVPLQLIVAYKTSFVVPCG